MIGSLAVEYVLKHPLHILKVRSGKGEISEEE
jgi:hypothetical protein